MSGDEIKLPFYAKVTIFLVGLFAFLAILYIAKSIIIPIVFATIIAILLHPVVKFFTHLKINRVVSIAIAMFITFLIIASFGILLVSQASRFSESWPALVENFTSIVNQSISEGADYFNRDPQKIHDWVIKTQGEILNKSTAAIGQTLVFVGSGLIVLFLLPVYIFLILFYSPLLLEFIHRLFGIDNQNKVTEIVNQVKSVIQRYLVGIFLEVVIIAVLDTAALLILGIEYALILGIFGALLNMIPYVGGLVAVAMPMMVAIVTKSPVFAVYVLIAYYIIQLIDNNYIVPVIVASKVRINALFSILVVIAGNAIWGIPGMFLSIPILAIVKLICDHIEPLKPWGFLLGDTMPPLIKIDSIFKKNKTKS